MVWVWGGWGVGVSLAGVFINALSVCRRERVSVGWRMVDGGWPRSAPARLQRELPH